MTPRQIASVRPKVMKYWRQLLEEIEGRGGQVNKKVAKSSKNEIVKAPDLPKATERKPAEGERQAPLFGVWTM
jgi:hypothetical protein